MNSFRRDRQVATGQRSDEFAQALSSPSRFLKQGGGLKKRGRRLRVFSFVFFQKPPPPKVTSSKSSRLQQKKEKKKKKINWHCHCGGGIRPNKKKMSSTCCAPPRALLVSRSSPSRAGEKRRTSKRRERVLRGTFAEGGGERWHASSSRPSSKNNEQQQQQSRGGRGGGRNNTTKRGWDTADKAYARFGTTKRRDGNYDDENSNNNRARQQQQRAVPLDELERKQIALERQKLRGGKKYEDDFMDYEDEDDEGGVDDLAGWSRFANESGIEEDDEDVSSSSSSRVKKKVVISSSARANAKVTVQSKYRRGGLRPWETQRMERETKKSQQRHLQNRYRDYDNDYKNYNNKENKPLSNNAFINAGLEAIAAENLNKAGLKRPTEIQKLAMPELIEGNSAVLLAETGSGKTFAYTLPLMSQVAAPGRGGTKVSGRCCPAMIIIVPNVELARQVSKMAELCSIWCQRTDFDLPAPTVFSIFGKEKKLLKPTSLKQRRNTNNRNRKYVPTSSRKSSKAGNKGNKIIGDLEEAIPEFRRADVLISTPARLLALAKDEWVLFGRLKHFVVDECDEMLSRGFADDVKSLIDLTYGENADGINKFGAKVQYVFAAATLKDSEPIFESFQGELSWISTGYFGKLHPQLEQEVVEILSEEETDTVVAKEDNYDDDIEGAQQRRQKIIRSRKNKALMEVLRKRKEYKSLVFANSPEEADEIVEYLNKENYQENGEGTLGMYSMAFHGKAKERGVVLDDFISGDLKVCVCTDLAARGIDFPELHHVVHYSLADSAAIHIHRTGRTARAGQVGPYYCTVLYDKEEVDIDALEDGLKELLGKSTKSSSRKRYQRSSSSSSSNATSAL